MMRRFAIVMLLVAVSACTQPSRQPTLPKEHFHQQLSQLNHWSLEGKVAIRHGQTSDSASLQWQQQGDRFDIYLSGPLGAGATRLMGDSQTLILANNKSQHTHRSNPQHFMEQYLGWSLPLEKLPQWIVGYSDSPNRRLHPDHTLAGFTEMDWQVEYLQYQSVGEWLLPKKVVLKHEDLQVTIVIKSWDLR